jgi:hypothetical protein
LEAKAVQALGEARIRSVPEGLRGETEGRNMRGCEPTPAEEGKVMTRERDTVEARETLALQGRGRLEGALGLAEQVPAVAGVLEALAQQAQAVQPGVWMAEAAQQHPPRHRLEAQSKALEQDSPGEAVAQYPEPGWQTWQPTRAAAALQQ